MSFLLKFSEWLKINPFNIVTLVVAVLSIVLATIFYIKSKKVKIPCYAIRSFNIIRDWASRIESLVLLYSNQKIENLTTTKIAIWNAGSDTIRDQDIASADPMKICIKEGNKILDVKTIYEKNPSNQFCCTIAKDQSHVLLNFDYIDKNEGAVIQILHTGQSSEDIEIYGTIKGFGKISRRKYFLTLPISFKEKITSFLIISTRTRKRRLFAIPLFIIPIVSALMIFPEHEQLSKPPSFIDKILILVVIFILYWGLGFLFMKRRIPKGFDAFEEEY